MRAETAGLILDILRETPAPKGRPPSALTQRGPGMAFKTGDRDCGPRAEFNRLSRLGDLKVTYPLIDVEDVNVYQWRLLLDWRDYLAARGVHYTFNHDRMFAYCVARLSLTPEGERVDVARKMIAFGLERGLERAGLEARVNAAISAKRLLTPSQAIEKKGEMTHVRMAFDLTMTPIRTATEAAGLVHGCLQR